MKLRYNRNIELEVVGLGVFKPNQIVIKEDEIEAQNYLDSGYFDEVKERKKKPKYKPYVLEFEKKKTKKSKKKGDDK